MVKKIIYFVSTALLITSTAFASGDITMATALASTTTGKSVYADKDSGATVATTSQLIAKTSTGVGVGLKSTNLGYCLVTQHINSTKAFGSAHDSTSIYSINVTAVGTAQLALPDSIGVSPVSGAGWTAM